jgi:multiple sugar transport system permease protein
MASSTRDGVETVASKVVGQSRRESLEEFLSDRKIMAFITVVPATLMFALIVAAPIVWSVVASLHSINALSPAWEFVGLGNYVELIGETRFWESFGYNLVWAFSTSVLNTVLGTAVALLLNQNFRFKRILTPVMLFPYLVPSAFFGYIVMWITTQQWGLLNQLLIASGLITAENVVAWFTGDPWTAMATLVGVHNWKFSIFVAILVYAKLQGIPDDLYEAAIMSGATKYQQFRDITLPYIKNVLFITVLLRGLWNFNMFDLIWVATNGNPIDSLITLPVYAYKIGFQFQELGKSNAVATTLFVVLSVVGIIYFKTAKPSQEVRVE